MCFSVHRFFLYLLLFSFLCFISGCRDVKGEAAEAAVHYARCLAEGNYDEYIKGMLSCDHASDQYVHNTRVLLEQMMDEKKAEGQTVVEEIVCGGVELQKDNHQVLAYLKFTFQDKSTETILMPLVRVDGKWRLR